MGASLRDRATRPADQAPAGLGDTASVPSAVYAMAPHSWCADYFTPGKSYLVQRNDGDGGFTITNDMGTESYCLWELCAHLRPEEGPCGSWTRLERAASAIEGFAQDAEERLDPKGESATLEEGDAQ